ncbi:MAG TPA: non-homologous end-joining DNA ligase [Acidimicrobiales bacterium]|nr:non-homologous end-joining DNA ligase [Acidimicrobiales bacterium]
MPLRWGIAPMKAVSSDEVPTDDGWEFEIKWDGNRVLAFVEGGRVRLQSSNKLDATARWPELAALAECVNARDAILDGEVVALDDAGRPSFSRLQQGEGPATYFVFDVLQVDGRDITALPYNDRRALLEQLVEQGPNWLVSTRYEDGEALMDAARQRGLEGIVAKRSDSPYEVGRRSAAWRKLKYRPQQEFVVGGWVPGTGNREHTMGAILVGVYEGRKLRYSGRVGTGFKERELQRLMGRFRDLASDDCPFDPPPPSATRKVAHWVRPEMVVEVAFAEWTHEDILRQSSYLAERDDKNPKKVVREI